MSDKNADAEPGASGQGMQAGPDASDAEGWTAGEIAALAEAQAQRAAEEAARAKKAAEVKAQEEYEAAAKEATEAAKDSGFTNKRAGEVIFRREMGEPEFWLTKEGLIPPRPVLSPEEEKSISAKVEIPDSQIPEYNPEHILSPEYRGVSNYEIGVGGFRKELEENLERLRSDPDANADAIQRAADDLAKMDTLYENYHLGMNVFRTAKGGRDRIKK